MFPCLGTHPKLAGSNSPPTILAPLLFIFSGLLSLVQRSVFNIQYFILWRHSTTTTVAESGNADISFHPDPPHLLPTPVTSRLSAHPSLFRGSEPPAALAVVEAYSEYLGKSPGDCKSPPTLPSVFMPSQPQSRVIIACHTILCSSSADLSSLSATATTTFSFLTLFFFCFFFPFFFVLPFFLSFSTIVHLLNTLNKCIWYQNSIKRTVY